MKTEITTRDLYGGEHLARVEDLRVSVHVYGLAIKDNEILISPQFDGYDFPGGTAEKGETHLETLVREFKEETGYDVRPKKLLGVYDSFFHHCKRDEDYQGYLIYYLVDVVGGKLSDAGFDEQEKEYASLARWVKIEDLKKMHRACSVDISADLIEKAIKSIAEN